VPRSGSVNSTKASPNTPVSTSPQESFAIEVVEVFVHHHCIELDHLQKVRHQRRRNTLKLPVRRSVEPKFVGGDRVSDQVNHHHRDDETEKPATQKAAPAPVARPNPNAYLGALGDPKERKLSP